MNYHLPPASVFAEHAGVYKGTGTSIIYLYIANSLAIPARVAHPDGKSFTLRCSIL